MTVGDLKESTFLFSNVFPVLGIELNASGQGLLAFEFATIEEVESQVALVSEDGFGIGLKHIIWIDTH